MQWLWEFKKLKLNAVSEMPFYWAILEDVEIELEDYLLGVNLKP